MVSDLIDKVLTPESQFVLSTTKKNLRLRKRLAVIRLAVARRLYWSKKFHPREPIGPNPADITYRRNYG